MISKFALIIANTEYTDPGLAQLTAPGKDAKEFGRVLDSPELGAFDDVIILLNENESKVSETIDYFFSLKKPDDLLLLYFSGHGVRDENGSLYLAVRNTNRARLRSTAIKSDFIREAMDESRSRRQILILDCCNSGAFAQGTKGETGGSVGTAKAFEGTGYGRVVLTASDSTQFAWEGDKVIGEETSNSLFTHFLVKGLEGEADRNGDGKITVDELYDYAYERIVSRTPKQTPGKWSYKQQGDIVLRENLKPRDVKPTPLPSDLLDLLSHPNSGVRKVGIQDLISLLDGKHLGLARGAEEKLHEIAASDDSFTLRKNASDILIARGLSLEQPAPIPFPKEEHKEVKKIEKPISVLPRDIRSPGVDRVREKTPNVLPDWKSIASRFNLRVLLGIGALLVVVSLAVAAFPALRNLIAPGVGSTKIGKDGATLVYVPAGEFTMGSDADDALVECQKFRSDCQRDWFTNEEPPHIVNLDAFWIDQTEVTNKMYFLCVEAGVCQEPTSTSSWTHSTYYGNTEFDDYPVIYVDWNMAKTYCEWADRRLPTEAEWEKAARGTDGRIYPWGNDIDETFANYSSIIGDTTAVRSYESGKSFHGAYDMAGNVWEWVSSSYQPYPYSADDGRENLDSSDSRVLRGGNWRDSADNVRSASRHGNDPAAPFNYLGFRCAVSANRQADITPLAQASTNIPSAIQTSQPTKTDTPSPTETPIPPTPTLPIGSTMISNKDDMTLLYVPAGEFTMGSDTGEVEEKPAHTVDLDAFWIDKTEVTNKMYALCVAAGSCKEREPDSKKSSSRSSYYGNSDFDNYPVINVSWIDAKAYCEWAGRRLPTEAEWEKAARGRDGRTYPWGNDIANSNLLNYGYSDSRDTTEVGKYPSGASPYGALDMAGNVWEWVNDWYDANYYTSSPSSNPQGPASGQERVLRGGSWDFDVISSYSRFWGFDPTTSSYTIGSTYYGSLGFRCAMSAAP